MKATEITYKQESYDFTEIELEVSLTTRVIQFEIVGFNHFLFFTCDLVSCFYSVQKQIAEFEVQMKARELHNIFNHCTAKVWLTDNRGRPQKGRRREKKVFNKKVGDVKKKFSRNSTSET